MPTEASLPGRTGRPHVLFTITSGWGIRNFVQSGIFARLAAQVDISVATTAALRSHFEGMARDGHIVRLVDAPESEAPARRWFRRVRKTIFQAVHNVDTARIKRATSDDAFVRSLQRISWRVQRALAAEWQLNLIDLLDQSLPTSRMTFPDGVTLLVNTSPFDPRDNEVQRAAQSRGLFTMVVIPSWDNPSSKGCILPSSDSVLVWSPIQKSEMLEYYPGFSGDQVIISGIPQFDAYSLPVEPAERERFLGSLGIPPQRKVILFSTSSPKLFAHEPTVLKQMADAIEAGRLGEDVHILVRCHPVDDAGRYAAEASRDCVTIFPSSLGSGSALADWRPPEAELGTLAASLRHCAVCVNTASTMTLDAASSGRPVVNIAYDPDGPKPFYSSVRRFYAYSHYARVVEAGYAAIAGSAEALVDSLADILASGQGGPADRDEFVAAFCPKPEGGSVAVIADQIARTALAKEPVALTRMLDT